ncbi:MAG: peptidylprolyl isomerase [Acidobacteriota bacterium]
MNAGLSRALLIAVLAATACAPSTDRNVSADAVDAEMAISDVIAQVNGKPLSRSSYEQTLNFLRKKIPRGDVERYISATREALDLIVNDELLYQEAQRLGLTATDEAVEKEFKRVAKESGGEARFLQRLSGQGLTVEESKRRMRKHLTIDGYVRDHITAGLTSTDEETLVYYNNHLEEFTPELWVRVQEILVRCARDANAELVEKSRERAQKIQEAIRGGESFDKMAEEFSEGENAARGGDLGFIKRGVAPPEFEAIAFSIRPGEVSDVIRSDLGFHIIRVIDRRGGKVRRFEEVKDQCRARVLKEKQQAAIQAVVSRLRATADIQTNVR